MHRKSTMCITWDISLLSVDADVRGNSWHLFKNIDIWSSANDSKNIKDGKYFLFGKNTLLKQADINKRREKVFHLFPVPVDGECLSNDGRRTGVCVNVYECRLKGGIAQGECSMGFGVCCIFLATCDQTIRNNITYLVSPNFPSSMPQNFTSCKYKLKLMDSNVSQIRIDFNHFSLGQPNRRTGICDGDTFNVSGGPSGSFILCGQNSGQHVYYGVERRETDIPTRKRLQTQMLENNHTMTKSSLNDDDIIEITMNFSNRFSPIRFWEIRIAQILFSQRAPANCLQYYTGHEGVIQTFNFADNGRHLANQDYKSCIRQEDKMCSIIYQPCDDHSFKIGPSKLNTQQQNNVIIGDSVPDETPQVNFSTQNSTFFQDQQSSYTNSVQTDNRTTTTVTPALADAEGSGEENLQFTTTAKPSRGGFDILSIFRSAFSFRKLARSATTRQFFTTCNDRITMPCIIEDFVDVGMGPLPGCEPVHCGNQFCTSNVKPCRIESTVTPFYLGVHFGKGVGKGSAEENIGACIRYTQVQCL
ncbi:uncharacterized protein LOC129950855 isoform X2 [Eupeodes corollae]|uniref:uncharacterized protein LOC129950855 isoform X2 n=1 Tax=Eupeodes corollae TaxID=290404 RepID=UPI0024924A58|nr:uncharacterized protein LOC129950855 isoform X2 [Eupeodes corollae]